MLSRQAVLARNNVHIAGTGTRPIVFAHGFGCDQHMWRFVSPSFEPGYRTVLFDYVGSGASDLSAFNAQRYSSLVGYAQDLLEICEALDLQNVVLVGHSVSSMIGLLAAQLQPQRFSALVMLVPSPCFINQAPDYVGGFERQDIEGLLEVMDHNYLAWAAQLAPMVMANPDRPELVAELEHSFCTSDPAAAKVFARTTFFADNRADLAKARHPTLMVQIRDDALVPPPVASYLLAHLPGSELVMLEGTGHCPHMTHPAATIDAIRGFLHRDHALA